ncbi:MAG TPA: cell division protein FtsH [Elusimicrobia bacterium]|nr:cell division protein FtsH [Elusimicrobiota bacterium]
MLWAKLKLFMQRYWLWVAVVGGLFVAIVLPMWYLAGMEESIRRYIIGINVASLPWGILQTLVFVGFLYLLQYGGGFAQFKKARIDAGEVKVRFSDVIGLTEAKREAIEVVQLLKDRSAVKRLGGNILRGILLLGPPGCGKTLIAKAIATEAGIPFLSVAGSEFVEVFVGVGAARVRKLFKQARQYAQAHGGCIIFIDELEVLGRSRVFHDAFGGSSEGNSTLNQLLVEMDGLHETDAHVLVIGAMNAAEDVLDPALLRPGRFDRKIQVSRPNLQEREQIFAFYARKIKLEPDVDLARLARKAIHKSPAEIENILKEGALIAARSKKELVGYKEITSAIERIELGVEHRLNLTPHEREMTAYHEAGHLVVLYLTHPTDDVFKASIIQRGGALGVVHHTPREELYTSDRNTWLANIEVSLGGYVAERQKYGVTTDGVSSDFKNAMSLAHTMVWRVGMGQSGFVGDFTVLPKEHLSEALKQQLNNETQQVLRQSLDKVDELLKKKWNIVERFAGELIRRDELDYDEIVQIFLEYNEQPRRPVHPTAQTAPPPPPPPAPGA